MHPAKSVIFFTTVSGAGYGMIVWLAELAALELLPADFAFGATSFALALALIIGGLLSSTFHLGRPERAWRALSQWRSSWLSREGLAALATFIPLMIFIGGWLGGSMPIKTVIVFGMIGAAMCLITLYCTAMIYASLKPIPAWHNSWTIAGYIALALVNGAVLTTVLLRLFGFAESAEFMTLVSLIVLPIALFIKVQYWRRIAKPPAVSTAGSATGLGHLGTVELAASPHGSDNYLLREMGFKIARKHADKLRQLAIYAGFVAPFVILAAAMFVANAPLGAILSLLAAIACQIGITSERWLFFAEAKHAVTLYYGEQAV